MASDDASSSTSQDSSLRPSSPASSISSFQDDGLQANSDIAIIGFSFEFPGASTTPAFWDLLTSGRCEASTFPPDRLLPSRLDNGNGVIRPSKASFVSRNVGTFDASFFGMTEDEAIAMDPQIRILLETTYRALEDAGIPLNKISGTDTSVYTGCFTAEYASAAAKDPHHVPRYAATGMAQSMLSNRLSSFFNLTGPSITVDTACSSSLVALDMACQSILSGDSSMSIVAGCNLLLTPDLFISLSNLGFLSPDGISRSFDSRANGYGRGEGFGVLLVKSVADAVRDGDTIRAVIRATATNQNGRTNLAMPSKELQTRLIETTYSKAGLDMSQTGYFEAHGTGTAVGDPIEASAIGNTLGLRRPRDDPIIVGSVKANIGHLEGAAGIAGVIKTILALEEGVIPPIAGLTKLNPEIDAEFLNLKFPTSSIPWPSQGLRRASINSFGFGGTNAHVILDDSYHYLQRRGIPGKHRTKVLPEQTVFHPSTTPAASPEFTPSLFSFSAHDETALGQVVEGFRAWLNDTSISDSSLRTVGHWLTAKRTLHNWRLAVTASSLTELGQQLASPKTPAKANPGSSSGPKLGLVFTGQGAQWMGMGKELFVYPTFRNSVFDADHCLLGLGCSWRPSTLLCATDPEILRISINEPQYAQPLCTILQVALVELLTSFGIDPVTVVGHSSGEIAAAYTSGAISRESAWKIAYYRGLLSNHLSTALVGRQKGCMMAVGLSEEDASRHIEDLLLAVPQHGPSSPAEKKVLTIACINSPSSVTISGDESLVHQLCAVLTEKGVFARLLKVPVAYHSPHMEEIASLYRQLIGDISPGANVQASMISSVTGSFIDPSELRKADYWVRNMVSPVRFLSAIEHISRGSAPNKPMRKKLNLSHRMYPSVSHLIEIGPHSALQQPIRQILQAQGSEIAYLSAIIRGKPATYSVLDIVGTLHCLGLDSINLERVNSSSIKDSSSDSPTARPGTKHEPAMCPLPPLPAYPFNHSQIYWSESRISKNLRLAPQAYNPFLGSPAADWNPLDARWRNKLTLKTMPWLADHKINGRVLFPAAGMCVMAIEGLSQLLSLSSADMQAPADQIEGYELREVRILNALVIPDRHGAADKSQAVEVEFRLRLLSDRAAGSKGSSGWAEFSLFLIQDEGAAAAAARFVEICQGSIKASYKTVQASDRQNGVRNDNEQIQHAREAFSLLFRTVGSDDEENDDALDGREADQQTIYQNLAESGYGYGPTFQGIQVARRSSRHGPGQLVGHVAVNNEIPSSAAYSNCRPVAIHPCDMDSMLQLALPPIVYDSDAWSEKTTWVPTLFSKIWVPGTGFTSAVGPARAQVHSSLERTSKRLCRAGIVATLPSGSSDSDVLLIEGTELTRITNVTGTESEHDSASTKTGVRRLGYDLVSLPDVGLLDRDQLREYLTDSTAPESPDGPFSRYLRALAHKNPGLKILEVGSSMTDNVLAALVTTPQVSEGQGEEVFCQFGRYDISETSQEELDQTTTRVTELVPGLGHKVGYVVLDMSMDVQGAKEGYDLVIASISRGMAGVDMIIKNAGKLLRDNGKFILIGATPERCDGDGSAATPALGWDRELRAAGFSVEFLAIPDCDTANQKTLSITISTKATQPSDERKVRPDELDRALVIRGWNGTSSPLTELVQTKVVNDYGIDCKLSSFADSGQELQTKTKPLEKVVIIVQDGKGWPSFSHLTSQQYSDLHRTLTTAEYILWIAENSAEIIGPVLGLARVLRKERYGLVFATVALEPSSPSEILSRCVDQALQNFFGGISSGQRSLEWELTQTGSMLHIPRVYESASLNCFIQNHVANPRQMPATSTGQTSTNNSKLVIRKPGLLETLAFEPQPPTSAAGPGEIEIELRSVGLNFRDCLVALGQLDRDDFGGECSGVVVSSLSDRFKPGDRVTACLPHSFRTGTVVCPAELAVKIPDSMSFAEAAAIPINYVTAYYSLVQTARLQQGESILIHSAAGGTGQAALQIAQSILGRDGNAKIFVTVGSKDKKDMLIERYGLAPERILYSRDLSFARDIRRLTGGKGVDVVLNSLAGDALVASWECVAAYGRFVEIGKKDILSRAKLPMYQFAKNVSFCCFDGRAMMDDRPDVILRTLTAVLGLFEEGTLRLLPDMVKEFPAEDVEGAFRHLQSGNNSGKVVVDVSLENVDDLGTTPAGAKSWTFNADAAYVMAGGLGAAGKFIAKWMVSKGARNLVLLSRSGPRSPSDEEFLEELRMQGPGAEIYCPRCDVSDAESLRQTLDYCKTNMPPIRGCIQAAMVLRDGLFESMDQTAWTEALRPKIDASWNLHEQLPQDLDFFILLSSVSGMIGSQGQANYAAGNTFQDELARYRISRGQRALSINLSLIGGDVGFSGENKELVQQMLLTKHIIDMSTDEMIAVLDYYCNPAQDRGRHQVVLGLDLPQNVVDRGMDMPSWMNEPMFSNLHQISSPTTQLSPDSRKGSETESILSRAQQAESGPEAEAIISGALVSKLCKVLGRGAGDFDLSQPLYTYGVDSLVAVELRNWLKEIFKVDVALFEILGGSSCTSITQSVIRMLLDTKQ